MGFAVMGAYACAASPDTRVAVTTVVLDPGPPVHSSDAGSEPVAIDAAPVGIRHAIDVNFENRIHLVGYRFDPESARPG